MAKSTTLSALALALLLPSTLAVPFGGNYNPWSSTWSSTPYPTMTSWTVSGTIGSGTVTAYSYSSATGYSTGYSTGFPTSYSYSSGTALSTGVSGTATGWSSPTGYWINKREAEALAKDKRDAFEAPRRREFPHHYPYSSSWGCSESTAGPTYPTATGPAPTGTAPIVSAPTGTAYSYTGWH